MQKVHARDAAALIDCQDVAQTPRFTQRLIALATHNITLYTATVLIWGTTWFAIEFQLGTVAPIVSVSYRYLLAAVLLFGFIMFRGLNLKFGLKEHGWFALMGLTLFGLNYVLTYSAQVYITSALSAIAFSTIVWLNIINSRFFFGVKSGRKVLFGALFGIAGLFTLFMPQISQISLSDSIFYGLLLSFGGAVAASLGSMASQAAQKKQIPIIQSNAWGMLYGSALSGGYAFATDLPFDFEWSASYLVSLGYLSVFGSIVAFGAYLTLLGRIGAHRAGYAMVMFPVVALIVSALFEGLRIDATIVVGTILVLAGNLFVMDKTK
ncbi:MAG: EamA family transporter [Pseudomonadota bacterium]